MNIIDDRESIKKIDKSNMLTLLENFDLQCLEANSIETDNIPIKEYDCIVYAGMGGSAIAGDILKNSFEQDLSIPFFVHRNYGLPGCVTKNSLVIAVSYSGNTEETIDACQQALSRGCTVLTLSSGGELENISKTKGIIHVKIPSGYPPRCGLGYLFFPVARILSSAGYIKSFDVKKIVDMISYLKKLYGVDSVENNTAKNIAKLIHNKMAVIYSGEFLFPAATRWKTQIAENSKHMISINVVPEMNHNEIMAWNFPAHFIKNCIVFFLYDRQDNERVTLRMNLVTKILQSKSIPVEKLNSQGEDALERIFSLIILGDWTSFYLAILNGVDPTEIKEISYLKQQMAVSEKQ